MSASAIGAILSGEEGPPAVERLLEDVARHPSASEELDFASDLLGALEHEREFLEQAIPERAGSAVLATTEPGSIPRTLLVALCVIALLWMLSRQRTATAGESVPPPLFEPSAAATREFLGAMQPYVVGDVTRAAEELRSFSQRQPEHMEARFYLAAVLEREFPTEAQDLLRQVADHEAGELGNRALWRLAHLELRLGKRLDADGTLNELARRTGSLSLEASMLLDELASR